jgi:hypothetical protein
MTTRRNPKDTRATTHEVATVSKLPPCNFRGDLIAPCSTPEAHYDFKTVHGPWANGCETHYQLQRAFSTLGLGKGQRLVVE